jgi:hypothetical protein
MATSRLLPLGPHEDETEVNSREALRDHIFAAAEQIHHHLGNISSANQSHFMVLKTALQLVEDT